jgi:hypothetical protein
MKKILLTLCIVAMTSLVMAQKNHYSPYDNGTPPARDLNYAPLVTCNDEKGYYDFPFTENGITVTGSGTGTYTVYPPGWGSCGIFAKANTFSQPVNDMIYNITATDVGEIITITTDAGTPSITYTDGSCPSYFSISGNVITCIVGPYPGAGGRFLIHSTSVFTAITFSHNGEGNGSTMTMCFDKVLVPSGVPISNWALFIGIGLILVFTIVRLRKTV